MAAAAFRGLSAAHRQRGPSLAEMWLIGINELVLWSGEHAGRSPMLVRGAGAKAGDAHRVPTSWEIATQ